MNQWEFLAYVQDGGALYPSHDPYHVGIMPGPRPSTFDFRDLSDPAKAKFAALWREGKLNFAPQLGVRYPGFHVLPFFLRIGPLRG